MPVKICLLISDDADDHQSFSEALYEYQGAIVLIVLDSQKAAELLLSKMVYTDFIFLDLSSNGVRVNTFLKTLREDAFLKRVPLIVYGTQEQFDKIEDMSNLFVFQKDYHFTELKKFLNEIIDSVK